jgi:two-component system, LytTR family, sensor histidine kinase AlgZ
MAVLPKHPLPPAALLGSVLAAPVVEYVFRPDGCTWREVMTATLASAIPLGVIPVMIYSVYRWALPPLLRAPMPRFVRVGLELVVVAGVTAVGGLVLAPVCELVHPRVTADLVRFVSRCVALGVAIFLPAILLVRGRAERAEMDQRQRAERQARIEAQLRALQARTSPHFLFNTLNTVASLIHDDPDLAEVTLERLAGLFRYSLDGAASPLVPIERELAVVEDYLQIQHARFGERFRWEIVVAPEAQGFLLPPLLIQPLVENAVLHGVSQRKSGGMVRVEAKLDAGRMVCTVSDNGRGGAPDTHEGTGSSAAELRDRLRLAFGEDALFDSQPVDGGGFRARLTLPRARGLS